MSADVLFHQFTVTEHKESLNFFISVQPESGRPSVHTKKLFTILSGRNTRPSSSSAPFGLAVASSTRPSCLLVSSICFWSSLEAYGRNAQCSSSFSSSSPASFSSTSRKLSTSSCSLKAGDGAKRPLTTCSDMT